MTDNEKITDESELIKIIDDVFAVEAKAKESPEAVNYLIGKVMQKTKGSADPVITARLIKAKMNLPIAIKDLTPEELIRLYLLVVDMRKKTLTLVEKYGYSVGSLVSRTMEHDIETQFGRKMLRDDTGVDPE